MAKSVRLDKFLADAGCGTRSEVKKLIQKNQVKVNDVIVKKSDIKVNPQEDIVILSGITVGAAPEFEYYMLNKPAGCVSATEDKNDKTVMEYVPSDRKGLFPVGRLDKDTEGLLLITDDGQLAHRLLSPIKHVDKTYFVRVSGIITDDDIVALESGVDIGEEKPSMPARVEVMRRNFIDRQDISLQYENLFEEYTELLLTIHEGKFHQVKRMMAAVDTTVTYLKRISMGPLSLPEDLGKGECRPLTDSEIQALKNITSVDV